MVQFHEEFETSMEEDEENAAKKIKNEHTESPLREMVSFVANVQAKPERCVICRQYSNEMLIYNGHPQGAVDEYVALTDDKLMLFTGDESEVHQHDERPTNKITHFSVYDKLGHLCPFDTGLIEANKRLYFSGYVKPIYVEDPSPEDGIPVKDMGPLNEWWISGFDGGEKALVGFTTEYGEYYLMEPSHEYQPLMKVVNQKILLCKLVIEFLLDEFWENPTYEDLLQRIRTCGNPELNEEMLLRHAPFICDQVMSYDNGAEMDDRLLITAPCMRTMAKMSGVTFQKGFSMKNVNNKRAKKGISWSKATTTDLVHDVFEAFFADQIEKTDKGKDKGPRKKRCGVCEACQQPDCGKCTHCRDMLKFGGSGRSKQACQGRRCPNMAIQEAEESDNEDEESSEESNGKIVSNKHLPMSKRIMHNVTWIGEPKYEFKSRTYYREAQVDEIQVEVGDYVVLNSEQPDEPPYVARVAYMFEEPLRGALFHAHLFCRGTDTMLGETADPRELFVVDICENCPLGSIVRKAQVEYRLTSEDWFINGGLDRLPPQLEDDGKTFFFTKRYDSEFSRFVDLDDGDAMFLGDVDIHTSCDACRRKSYKSRFAKALVSSDGSVLWEGKTYMIGSGVFLEPDVFKFKEAPSEISVKFKKEEVDADLYPEYYRKNTDTKGSNTETPKPFCIGLIEEIIGSPGTKEIKLQVRKFYRPENTHKGMNFAYKQDLNMVYWSNEVLTVPFGKVMGKCYLIFGDDPLVDVNEWTKEGPFRFYFRQCYDAAVNEFKDVPVQAMKIGQHGKGKGKGKGKSNKQQCKPIDLPEQWPVLKRPLRCMDVFAGCGGLSEGLHQSGVADTKWAIEKDPAAAQAFSMNNPTCTVFTDDCNELLRLAMNGEGKGKEMPQKGDVEMLVGGPPCQGFSGMNRFNAGQYSLFKNSLIVSYLSYCDYYRPKYFILENVRNFVSFKRSMVLKLTLRCLLAMGYQVTFGVLQAGHYGVPQTRRRLIIMAAAPGYILPKYPEPKHVFSKRGCQLSVVVGDFKFTTGAKWTLSAPYRTITVRDAMSDLPQIKNGCSRKEMPYDGEPLSNFQRLMRGSDRTEIVRDHICKEMAPLVEARMAHVPLHSGADWRDLPNIVVKLSDGTYTTKLRYPHRTKKQKKDEPPRGVCLCSTGKPCDPADRQFNTLIPWCLPHTADRHNHWSGLYGRLEWDGFFSTTVTNPEPMGKQGRVLHPEQHRLVSVRECARSQGFPDTYVFSGSVLDKHRQVGNAVPPPLGIALGREFQKALAETLFHKSS